MTAAGLHFYFAQNEASQLCCNSRSWLCRLSVINRNYLFRSISVGSVVVRKTRKLRPWNSWSTAQAANIRVTDTNCRSALQAVAVCCAVMILAALGTRRAVSASDVRVFEVPAQSLGDALESFARIANREILYEGRLTEHRRSAEVRGAYASEVALEILLAGTGLEAKIQDRGFFVLTQVEEPPSNPQQYYALIQAALRQVLCNAPEHRRIAAHLWVGRSGKVLQVRGLGGDEVRARTEAALKGATIGVPPANFAQPITILVQAKTTAECGPAMLPSDAAP
jgi:hypothetical protein